MAELHKRFNRAQRAAEQRSRELEAEKFDYPLYYVTYKEDGLYDLVLEPAKMPFKNDGEIMSYIDELLLEGEN